MKKRNIRLLFSKYLHMTYVRDSCAAMEPMRLTDKNEDTRWKYKMKIQNKDTKWKYKMKIQNENTKWKYKMKIQNEGTKWRCERRYKYRVKSLYPLHFNALIFSLIFLYLSHRIHFYNLKYNMWISLHEIIESRTFSSNHSSPPKSSFILLSFDWLREAIFALFIASFLFFSLAFKATRASRSLFFCSISNLLFFVASEVPRTRCTDDSDIVLLEFRIPAMRFQ